MRCTSIEKYKCRVSVDWELTNHKVRLIWNLLHIHVVHCGLLAVGWLQSFPLWTVVSIVSLLLALEAHHLTQILLHKDAITVAVMSTVSSRVMRCPPLWLWWLLLWLSWRCPSQRSWLPWSLPPCLEYPSYEV